MNIVSHFAKNLLKERIKEKISSLSTSLVDKIIDNLGSYDNNKYLNLFSSIHETTIEIIKNIIIDTFIELDNQYKVSSERKKYYSINKSNINRSIMTIFGEISFSRTYYISKLDNSYHFYIDELFDLPKYDHYDPIIKSIAIDKSFSSNQLQAGIDTGELFTNIKLLASNNRSINKIPRQTINNWIKSWHNPNIKYDSINTPNNLYIMADEKFIGCQDLDNDIMTKCMIAFEDVKKVSKNRNKLINRTVYTTYSNKPWEEFSDILAQKYDLSKVKNIYLLGDGGSWIKSGINELKLESNISVSYLLCLFHFKQSINRITTNSEDRKMLLNTFDNMSKKLFKEKVDKIIEDNSNRKENIARNLDYILNNYDSIKRMKNSPIGSSMESHVSHCIAKNFASRPKGYSSLNIKQYLQINDYKNNNFNIIDLYLQTYHNNEKVTLNENKINFSIFDKKGSNIPVIDYGIINGSTYVTRTLINY